MKSPIRHGALAGVLVVALGSGVHAASTSGTIPAPAKIPAAEPTYPSVLPLTLEVSADKAHQLRALRGFTITAQLLEPGSKPGRSYLSLFAQKD